MTIPIPQSVDTLAGRTSTSPFITQIFARAPTGSDMKGFLVGQRWVDTSDGNAEYFLLNFTSSNGVVSANWVLLSSGSETADTFVTDSGTATPTLNSLTLTGAGGITTSGSGNTVTFTGSSAVTSFTATITGSSSTGTASYSTQSAKYVTFGKLCYVAVQLTWTGHTGTGNMRVSGLPFAASGTGTSTYVVSGDISSIPLPATSISNIFYLVAGQSIVNIATTQDNSINTAVQMSAGGSIAFEMFYFIA